MVSIIVVFLFGILLLFPTVSFELGLVVLLTFELAIETAVVLSFWFVVVVKSSVKAVVVSIFLDCRDDSKFSFLSFVLYNFMHETRTKENKNNSIHHGNKELYPLLCLLRLVYWENGYI